MNLPNYWIATYTGKAVDPINAYRTDIYIEDIAHALSMLCRFTGHCPEFYSVAQHSILVSHTCHHDAALWGLLHDASEAYLSDIARPVKQQIALDAYRASEKQLQNVICLRFGLMLDMPETVKEADATLLASEARWFFSHQPLYEHWHHHPKNGFRVIKRKPKCLSPRLAERAFLERFRKLGGK